MLQEIMKKKDNTWKDNRPIDPVTQRIILKIVGFLDTSAKKLQAVANCSLVSVWLRNFKFASLKLYISPYHCKNTRVWYLLFNKIILIQM